MDPQRPLLLGLICWILILGGLAGLALGVMGSADKFVESMQLYPYPPLVAEILQFAPRVLLVIIGILLYERQGWARYLFIVVTPFFLLQSYFTTAQLNIPPVSPSHAQKYWIHQHVLYLSMVLYVATIVYLFLKHVRRYYHPPQYIDG